MSRSVKEEKVHNPRRRYEYAMTLLHKSDILDENKRHIEKFAKSCLAEGIGKLRVTKYIYLLTKVAGMLEKDFSQASREDIEKIVYRIEESDYSEWTKHDYRVSIKKFYKWLKGNGEEYPPEVKWIKPKKNGNQNHKLPEELITPEDVKKLAAAATNLRDKAMILTLYESGARAGELLSMKIKHVVFDKYGALVMLSGKTGMRRIRLVASVPAISAWLNAHPFKDDPEAWLWCSLATNYYGKRLTYTHFCKILDSAVKKSGLKKKIHPHLFRHSRATELAKTLTEAQLCQVMGWVIGSKQPARYVHLSQRDTDRAILGIYGLLDVKEDKEEKLMAVECPRCHQNNSPGARFCYYCGMALDVRAAIESDEREKQLGINIAQILQDPDLAKEITEMLLRKVMEKNKVFTEE